MFTEKCYVVNGSVISESKYVMEEIKEPTYYLKHHNNGQKKLVGQIRYHYDDHDDDASKHLPSCSYVMVIGVGTSMSVSEYDKLSHQIVTGTSIVMIISNHNVGGLVKTSSDQYSKLLNAINEQLHDLVPACTVNNNENNNTTMTKNKKIIIGGHSSSGQAAFEASLKGLFHFKPFGFVGLDPYEISVGQKILHLPSLYWGLTDTTCLVNVDKAALGAYHRTSEDARILYSIDNSQNKITHCVFSDRGCGIGFVIVCPTTTTTFDWVYEIVAESVHLFINTLVNDKPFKKDDFELPQTKSGKVFLRVNENTNIGTNDFTSIERTRHPFTLISKTKYIRSYLKINLHFKRVKYYFTFYRRLFIRLISYIAG